MFALIKKKRERQRERNSPVKSGNATEIKEEALMPVMLPPRQLTVVDGRRLESRERSENKTKWISSNL